MEVSVPVEYVGEGTNMNALEITEIITYHNSELRRALDEIDTVCNEILTGGEDCKGILLENVLGLAQLLERRREFEAAVNVGVKLDASFLGWYQEQSQLLERAIRCARKETHGIQLASTARALAMVLRERIAEEECAFLRLVQTSESVEV